MASQRATTRETKIAMIGMVWALETTCAMIPNSTKKEGPHQERELGVKR
jgi:hypothetical protein